MGSYDLCRRIVARAAYLIFNIEQGKTMAARNLDEEVIRPFKLTEALRREAAYPSPSMVEQPNNLSQRPQAQRQPTFLDRLNASIAHDPHLQIAYTIRHQRFDDHVQLAKEICELTAAPPDSEAEVLALKFAVKLFDWAKAKIPPNTDPAE